MDNMHWFALFCGFNGLLIVALASLVSWRRIQLKIPHGDGGQIAMKQAIRTHGNAIEHVPVMGLIVLAHALLDSNALFVGALVLSFSFARLLHPLGMLSRAFNARRLGALLTYLAQAIGALGLLLQISRA